MAWTPGDIPDQHRRVAVVTGANSGLGLQVTRVLAGKGARVVMAARDQGRANKARRLIAAGVPDADLEIRELDLASLGSVRAMDSPSDRWKEAGWSTGGNVGECLLASP